MYKKILLGIASLFCLGGLFFTPTSTHAADAPNFYTALNDSVKTDFNILRSEGVKTFLQKASTGTLGAGAISDFIVNLFLKVLIPIFAICGIVLAILGFFKLMSSDQEAELKKGWNFITWGIIGTLLMVSAAWIVMTYVGADGIGGILKDVVLPKNDPSGAELASHIYRKLAFPFIKVALNVILGILFLIAAGNTFKYLFSGDEKAQKEAISILVYTVVGCIVIVLAKMLVENIYGAYDTVVQGDALTAKPNGEDVGVVGDGVLENPNMDMLYIVINWVLGIGTFLLTIIIVYIGYLLLTQPKDDKTADKLRKAITRALAGILVIGIAYVFANFVIIK